MELPDSIKAIGEQVEAGAVTPAPAVRGLSGVRAEVAHLFTRPWLAVDHASRLAADGDYFRADIGSRSVVLVRETEDRIHALRNARLHAGYRVRVGKRPRRPPVLPVSRLVYALDGRLTDPLLRPEMTDRCASACRIMRCRSAVG